MPRDPRVSATSPSPGATPSTRSTGSSATPSSPARTAWSSSRRVSSSRSSGRRRRRTSSRRSTSAAACPHPSASRSVKQMIGRVVDTIGVWGREGGYFEDDEQAETFEAELKAILVNQLASFNSPGLVQRRLRGAPAVVGVLHPLDRRLDGLDPRLDPARGDHLPRRLRLRASTSPRCAPEGAALQGRLRLGPVSLRGADASASARSSRAARRGARPRWLPRRRPPRRRGVHLQGPRGGESARPRSQAYYDMSLDSPDWASIQYQNANNSIRVTDAFMEAVERRLEP